MGALLLLYSGRGKCLLSIVVVVAAPIIVFALGHHFAAVSVPPPLDSAPFLLNIRIYFCVSWLG